MTSAILGRTNRAFPPVWLRLGLPHSNDALEPLLDAASEAALPIDITSQPGLWGGRLRAAEKFFTYVGSCHYENATDEAHSANLVEADLIQTLSAIGNETLDVYFVRVRRAVEEFQLNGVLSALESAKQEGHIRFIGLCCDGNPFAALSTWQFHDAFDLLLTPSNPLDLDAYRTLTPLAHERRVGIVGSKALDWLGDRPFEAQTGDTQLATAFLRRASTSHPTLASVRSAFDVHQILRTDFASPLSERENQDLDLAVSQARARAQLDSSDLFISGGSRVTV